MPSRMALRSQSPLLCVHSRGRHNYWQASQASLSSKFYGIQCLICTHLNIQVLRSFFQHLHIFVSFNQKNLEKRSGRQVKPTQGRQKTKTPNPNKTKQTTKKKWQEGKVLMYFPVLIKVEFLRRQQRPSKGTPLYQIPQRADEFIGWRGFWSHYLFQFYGV